MSKETTPNKSFERTAGTGIDQLSRRGMKGFQLYDTPSAAQFKRYAFFT